MTDKHDVRAAGGTPSGGPAGWKARKLAEICDADRRRTNPATAAVATALIAGAPMPDPQATREQFHSVLFAARMYLVDQPSPRQITAAARRLTTAITDLAGDMAKTAKPRTENGE